MPADLRVGYVVKRYPRFSETFIVNEILAHEAAGLNVDIFALYPPNDTHFQDAIARVRAPVTYITADGLRGADLWAALDRLGGEYPDVWRSLALARGCDARTVYQAALLTIAIRQRGITHLHAHFATVAAQVARLASAWSHTTYSVTAHAKDIFHESVHVHELQRALESASSVITVSDFNVNHLTTHAGLPRHRVHRIYNGIDLERFAGSPGQVRQPRIISVGRLVPKKGIDVLLEACALLRLRGVPFDCLLIGGGPEEGHLRALAQRLGLQDVVTFAGPRPQPDVIAAVREAAVFAAPCVVADDGDRDGLPTVLLEAMALGTPVVATSVVGIPEVVRDGITGLLVPERDAGALAHALERCLKSASLRDTLSAGAQHLIGAEFDVTKNAAALRTHFAPGGLALARAS